MSDLIDRDYIVNVGPLGTFEKSGTYLTAQNYRSILNSHLAFANY